MAKGRSKYQIHLKLESVSIEKAGGYDTRRIPYSPNITSKMHWTIRKRWTDAWKEEVCNQWLVVKNQYKEITKALQFLNCEIQFFVFTNRQMDDDNLFGSLKPVVDGLKEPSKTGEMCCGIIKDDAPPQCRIAKPEVIKVASKEAEHIEIIIKRK